MYCRIMIENDRELVSLPLHLPLFQIDMTWNLLPVLVTFFTLLTPEQSCPADNISCDN